MKERVDSSEVSAVSLCHSFIPLKMIISFPGEVFSLNLGFHMLVVHLKMLACLCATSAFKCGRRQGHKQADLSRGICHFR